MKKLMLWLTMGAVLPIGFVSCNNDDDDGGGGSETVTSISASNVVNGSSQIVSVAAWASWDDGVDWGWETIAQSAYNNGFTLQLPANLAAKFLDSFEGIPSTISVSNTNALTFLLDEISGFNSAGEEIGYFYLAKITSDAGYYTSWMYADSNVTVKGQVEDEDGLTTLDLNLKQGWNVIYDTYTESSVSMTSAKPSGISYTWNFYPNSSYVSARMAAKSNENVKSGFLKLKDKRK